MFILFVVNGMFFFCWFFYFIGMMCLIFINGLCLFFDSYYIIIIMLVMLNSCCNLFIYILIYWKFRSGFQVVILCFCFYNVVELENFVD